MTRSFTTSKINSTHGTRKAAEAEVDRRLRYSNASVTYTVEHTGPRLFVVISRSTVESDPSNVRRIMDGQQIVCDCGSDQWYYTGRSLFNLNYECAGCARTISPVSETGACQ